MASNKEQVMTIGATSIEEQLVQMKETIARLIKTAEEKNLQTTALINRLEAQHGVKAKPNSLPTKRTEEGFDPNAYKLMSKAGYDFSSTSNLGKKNASIVNDKERDLTETQRKLKEHGYGVDNNKAGLGFTPEEPVKISSKAKDASAQHISVSIKQDQEEPVNDFKKDKVFAPKVEGHGKKPAKEAFTIDTAPVKTAPASFKISSKSKAKEIKKDEPFRTQDRYKNTLRELEQKTCPFPDSEVAATLDDLLEKKLVMKPAQQGRIELDLEDAVAMHTATIAFGSFDPVPLQKLHDHSRQSSSHTTLSAQPSPGASDRGAPTNKEEKWTLVTSKKTRKPRRSRQLRRRSQQ